MRRHSKMYSISWPMVDIRSSIKINILQVTAGEIINGHVMKLVKMREATGK